MSYFEIGKIVNTQGVQGEIRVVPTTDEPEKFKRLKGVDVYIKGETKPFEIESARSHKQFIILKLKGVGDMDAAHSLRGGIIRIPEEQGVQLQADEYYIRDIYDMEVRDGAGTTVGQVKDIIFTGANDVYVVERAEGKDLLLPAIKQCILNVDVENKVMTVRILEGLEN